jgi:hypothetical protein
MFARGERMSDDFGTVNVRRGDRAREIEVMRQQYRAHRDALSRMAADAPTELLAGEYQRLVSEIDVAMRKLDEIEGRAEVALPPQPPPLTQFRSSGPRTSPGDRPLVVDPHEDATVIGEPLESRANSGSRVAIIVVAGMLVLAAIVWLIWRGSEGGAATPAPVVEQPSTVAPLDTATPAPLAQPSALSAGALKITPALADYGTIRKGTRAVRQFEVTNGGSSPLTLQVARSACRCLYYDYHDKVAPKAKETLTITIDGAKAKAGPLRETLAVKAKEDPSLAGEITVQATIK